MSSAGKGQRSVFPSICLIVACVVLLVSTDYVARGKRSISSADGLRVIEVPSQADCYAAYKDLGLWGVEVVHFGMYFNLMSYFPEEQHVPVPFPIVVEDVRPLYEKGIDSHSWLFIANRNGLVRKVTSVLPEEVFRQKTAALSDDVSFKAYRGGFSGYSFDLPRTVFGLEGFICPTGPVVANIDASIFSEGVSPETLHEMLVNRCPDIRVLLLISSVDEPEVNETMRDDLSRFEALVKERGI